MKRWSVLALAALSLAFAVPARPGEKPGEKREAAKVAKKVEDAQDGGRLSESDRKASKKFQSEVAEYVALHAKQLERLGSPRAGAASDSVAGHKGLAQAIQAKRAGAEQGDVFSPKVQPLFRRLIAEQLKGPGTLDARKAVLEGNPPMEKGVQVALRVNAEYPPGAPISTVPPSLLLTLPALPAPLQYGFVGRSLILLDSDARLIVDFLPDAAPALSLKATP